MSQKLVICPDKSQEKGKVNSVINITFVKKIKPDGSLCAKSADVFANLKQLGFIERINKVVFADERQTSSHGLDLALKYKVNSAPFFIVDRDDGSTQIYTMYCRFLNEILGHHSSEKEEIYEIMAQNPDLDFI